MTTAYIAIKYAPVTKANADLPDGPCFGLLVGTAGTATVVQLDGTERTITLPVGFVPIAVKQIKTGGTADAITALYN